MISQILAAGQTLPPISLGELECHSSLLNRIDTKYIVPLDALVGMVEELAATHHVLEIDGRRAFGYESTYFDTPSLLLYRAHVQGRRRRFKVRSRLYVDHGSAFFEVKLKSKRGETVKRRMEYGPNEHGSLTMGARTFLGGTLRELYGGEIDQELGPVLRGRYDRITFVSNDRGERLTCDLGVAFALAGPTWVSMSDAYAIVERKSRGGSGAADQMLRRRGARPVRSCSKYCLGVGLLRSDAHANGFRRILKRYFEDASARPGSEPEGGGRPLRYAVPHSSDLRARSAGKAALGFLANETPLGKDYS